MSLIALCRARHLTDYNQAYRLAKQQTNLSGLPTSTRTIYHTLNPHPALSPVPEPSDPIAVVEQDENEDVYRQLLVHGMLAVLLPTEDLENACLRTLVGDVLADLLMGNEVSRRVCEGWFIWESISKLLDTVEQKGPETNKEAGQQDRLKTFGLLTKEEPRGHVPPKSQSRVAAWIWMFLHGAYLTYVAFRFIASGLLHVTSSQSSRSTPAGPISYGSEAPKSAGNVTGKRPVLDYRLYSMISQLIDVPRRMPWLTGMLALMQYMILAGPGRVGDTGSVLDR